MVAATTVGLAAEDSGVIPQGLAALAIVQALSVAGIMQYSVRLFTETEQQVRD